MDDFPAIQTSCALTASMDTESFTELDRGIVYFNLPPGSVVHNLCDFSSKILLEGSGQVTIPWGCSVSYGLTTIFNLDKTTIIKTQKILHISFETITNPKLHTTPGTLLLISN